ncbi:MAG: MATE family efflux transporter [Sulfolobales archaeon]|nr:MATE family efflux transporter [Sulfolobales archaeon]MCX8209307.1 MATE family efflux transporter [Sulfolobales archaeon]MDW8010602.1 MATE family efflux transporter [Sulfolobales archaeon]
MPSGMGVAEKYRDKIVSGSPLRVVLWLAAPLVLAQLVHVSYNVVDALWLSKLYEGALAVPRQVWPTLMFFYAVAMALSSANLAMISQYVGAKLFDSASRTASKLLTFNLLLAVAICSLYFVLRPYIFSYITSVPPEIYGDVMRYSSIMIFDILFMYLGMAFTTILQAIGDTRTPTYIGIAGAVLNILLDPVLIFGWFGFPAMGAAGAAIATVVSRALVAVVAIKMFFGGFKGVKLSIVKPDRAWALKSVKIALPVAALHMSNSLAFMAQLRLVNMFGKAVATAYSIGFTVIDIADAAMWGFSQATAIVVGQLIGAQLFSKARNSALISSAFVGLITAVGAIVVYVLRYPIASVFTSNPDVLDEATRFIEYFGLTVPFFAVFFIGFAVGRGSGHTYTPSAIAFIRLWGMRIALGYFLAVVLGLGPIGIWLSMAISNVGGGVLALAWVALGNWVRPVVEIKPVKPSVATAPPSPKYLKREESEDSKES